MGKIRTRVLGLENIDKKIEAEKEAKEKKPVDLQGKGKKESKESALSAKRTSKGKKHQTAEKKCEKGKKMKLLDAVELLKKVSYASFDESFDLHINVDKTGLRGEVELPFATGKMVRVAIVSDALLEDLAQGKIEFDILVTHPSFMPKLARFAKVLGPKGMMPNPKAGTISTNPEEVVKKFQKGMLRFKTEPKFPIIHQMIGKKSHDSAHLAANADAFIKAIGKMHIKNAFITTTMSPSIEIEIEKEKEE